MDGTHYKSCRDRRVKTKAFYDNKPAHDKPDNP